MEELTSNDLLYLHSIVENKFKVFKGVKDIGLVQAIADRPNQKLHGDFVPYQDIFAKAASLMEGIIRMHPFYDGNKRTALLATIAYLQLNGYTMVVPLSAVRFTVDIAKTKENDPESNSKLIRKISKWIKKLSGESGSKIVSWKALFYVILPLIGIIPISLITLGYAGKRLVDKWMAFDVYPEYEKESKEIMSFILSMLGRSIAKDMRTYS